MKKIAALILVLLYLTARADAAIVHEGGDVGRCGATALGNMSAACGTGASEDFTYTPFALGAGSGVLIAVGCGAGSNPSTATLTALNWTITQVKAPSGGNQGGWLAIFKAYTPDLNMVTFTVTWGADCGGFMNDMMEEFSGVDPTDFIDASNTIATAASGGCPAQTVTPVSNDTAIWFACLDTATAVGGAYTKGNDDGAGDWTEWKILTGGAGVGQTASFTGSGAYTIGGIAVKPSGAAAAVPTRSLLGVGQRLALFLLSRPHSLLSLLHIFSTAAP